MNYLKELSKKELIEIEGGGLFDGVEWWEGSSSNGVVGLFNAAYNAGVIAGNVLELTTAVTVVAIDKAIN